HRLLSHQVFFGKREVHVDCVLTKSVCAGVRSRGWVSARRLIKSRLDYSMVEYTPQDAGAGARRAHTPAINACDVANSPNWRGEKSGIQCRGGACSAREQPLSSKQRAMQASPLQKPK